MFNNLLESRRKRQRTLGSMTFSVFAHFALIALAVKATSMAGREILQEQREEKIDFVEVKKEEPPPPDKPPPPPDTPLTPPPPKGFQLLVAPVEIPDVLPEIDLNKAVTNEADFTGRGTAGGTSSGVVGGVPQAVQSDHAYWEFQVEKPAQWISGSGPPDYPEVLKSAGISGTVLATFIVDENGRADAKSFKVLKSTHELFTAAVRRALPQMRFLPAEVGDKKVKQVVQQEFAFSIGG